MKSFKDKTLLFSLLGIALLAGVVGGRVQYNTQIAQQAKQNKASVLEALSNDPVAPPDVTLGFVGDLMLDRSVAIKVRKNLDDDFSRLFENAEFLKEPDIMFGNLEGPVSTNGRNVGSIYSFRMQPRIVPVLKDAGFDVLSVANNHAGDWTYKAFEDTLGYLKDAGILACGGGMNAQEARRPAIVDQEGYRIGFICFSDTGPAFLEATEYGSGILLTSSPDFDDIIKNAKKEVNTLIVSFHWGEEYVPTHSDRQEVFAKRAIDAGADMIVGHHPHVVQDDGTYNNSPIFYSLGNFIFDQPFSEETMRGLFVTAKISDGKISDIQKHPTVLDENYAVSLK